MPFTSHPSLSQVIPLIQRRLALITLALTLIVIWHMLTTSFTLG